MPKIAFPRSDSQRLILLSQLGGRLSQPASANQVPERLRQAVFMEKSSFEVAVKDFAEVQRVRSEALHLRNDLLVRLKKMVRLFVARLRNRARFAETDLDVLFFSYNLHPKRNPVAYKDPAAWCGWANDLIIGEQREIAQGREPIYAPSLSELMTLRDQTAAAVFALAQANRSKKAAGIVLAARRPLLTTLLRRVAAYLLYRCGGDSKANRTAYFRSMGFRFITRTRSSVCSAEPVATQEVDMESRPKLQAGATQPTRLLETGNHNHTFHRASENNRESEGSNKVPRNSNIEKHTTGIQPFRDLLDVFPIPVQQIQVGQNLGYLRPLTGTAGTRMFCSGPTEYFKTHSKSTTNFSLTWDHQAPKSLRPRAHITSGDEFTIQIPKVAV